MKSNVIRGNFSMGQIDEVSSLLGELKSGISHIREEVAQTRNLQASIDGKIDTLTQDDLLRTQEIKALWAWKDEVHPKITRHDTIIGRMIWLGSLIITGITLLINWVSPFLGRLFH